MILRITNQIQDIQEATASEPLSLEEEYENQQSWRTSDDKLTFILCQPLLEEVTSIRAGVHDTNDKMIGDINFFIYAHPTLDDKLIGELDVMVAEHSCRRSGIGAASCASMLSYIYRNIDKIIGEYGAAGQDIMEIMVKIKEGNVGSRRLFKVMGFEDDGEGVNYFGEVKMLLPWEDMQKMAWFEAVKEGAKELPYENSLATKAFPEQI